MGIIRFSFSFSIIRSKKSNHTLLNYTHLGQFAVRKCDEGGSIFQFEPEHAVPVPLLGRSCCRHVILHLKDGVSGGRVKCADRVRHAPEAAAVDGCFQRAIGSVEADDCVAKA